MGRSGGLACLKYQEWQLSEFVPGDPSNPRHPNTLTVEDWAAGFESMQDPGDMRQEDLRQFS
eukprot:1965804-Amphidinium_carterae.1